MTGIGEDLQISTTEIPLGTAGYHRPFQRVEIAA